MNGSALEYAAMLVLTAGMAGRETSNKRYGWAVTFALLFFALLKLGPM